MADVSNFATRRGGILKTDDDIVIKTWQYARFDTYFYVAFATLTLTYTFYPTAREILSRQRIVKVGK